MAAGFVDYLRLLLGWWSSTAEAPEPPVGDPVFGAPRWPLTLHLYESRGGALVYTFQQPRNLTISENEHGFESLTGFQEMLTHEAFWLYDLAPAKWVVLNCGGMSVWEGRLEDRKIQRGGFGFTAFGGKRAMDDAPYTALWSTKSFAGIRPVSNDELSNVSSELWEMDNNNRLYIAPRVGETYGHTEGFGELAFKMPHNADNELVEVEFDFDWNLPTDWQVRIMCSDEDFAARGTNYTFTSSGSQSTGSTTVTLIGTGANRYFELNVRNQTGAPVTYTGETGQYYAKLTNMRLKGTASANVFADEIVGGLVAFVSALNPGQLSSSLVGIQSPNVDLEDEIYEDMTPASILNYLVSKGDGETPPRKWEWGVWEDQVLFFRPQGDAAFHWYVDADQLNLDSTLESLTNSVYAIYQDSNGRTLRTVPETDADSQLKYGLLRRATVSERTTSLTKAELTHATFLAQNKDIAPRASLTLYGLFDAVGAAYPLWMARAGDTLTIRNLPPTLSNEIDKIRTFRISRKSYDVEADILTPTPEYPLPTLAFQVASAWQNNNQALPMTPRLIGQTVPPPGFS